MDYIQFAAFLFFSSVSLLCAMYISNEKLKESINGEKFLKSAEWILTKTLFGRAESTIQTDLKSASSIFKKITFGLIALAFISEKLNLPTNDYFLLTGALSLFIWASLSWGRNPYKETIDYLKQFLFLAAGAIGLCFFIPNIEPIYLISEKLDSLGIINSPLGLKLVVSAVIIFILFIFYLLSCIMWTLFNSIFVGAFLLLSRLTAIIADRIINIKKGYSFYIFVIGFVSTLFAGSLFDKEWIF